MALEAVGLYIRFCSHQRLSSEFRQFLLIVGYFFRLSVTARDPLGQVLGRFPSFYLLLLKLLVKASVMYLSQSSTMATRNRHWREVRRFVTRRAVAGGDRFQPQTFVVFFAHLKSDTVHNRPVNSTEDMPTMLTEWSPVYAVFYHLAYKSELGGFLRYWPLRKSVVFSSVTTGL